MSDVSKIKKSKIRTILKSRKKYVEDQYNKFLLETGRDLEYYRGKQFTDEQRQKLEEEERPVVEFNYIKGKINTLKGQQSQSRYYFKCISADNVDEQEMIEYDGQQIPMDQCAKLITDELKLIEEENDGEYELSDGFGEGIAGTRTYFETFIRKDKSDFPYKLQALFEHRGYNEVFPDPDSKKYDLSDARYHFKFRDISKDDLITMFPKKEKEILKLKRTDTFFKEAKAGGDNDLTYEDMGSSDDKEDIDEDVILVEYFYYKIKKSHVVIVETIDEKGQPISKRQDVEDNKLAELEKMYKMRQALGAPLEYKVFPIEKKVWYIASQCDDVSLDDDEEGREIEELPDESPITQYCPDVVKSIQDMELKYIGAVRDLRSPQYYVNVSKGKMIAHLDSSVHSGIAHEEGALKDPDQWEKFGSAPGFRGEITKGQWEKWKQLFPQPLSQGHAFVAEDSANIMKDISNIRDEFAGQTSEKGQSGKAINLLQNAAFKGVHFYFDNFRRTKHLIAKKLVKLICYIKGVDHRKLKVVIDDAAESPTARYANWLETKEMLEAGALDSPYGDLIIQGMNITNRDEWVQRWNEANQFAQWLQEMKMKEEAEQLAIQDAQAEGIIPKGAA